MVDKKNVIAKTDTPDKLLFTKDNFVWMGIGAAIIASGMILMSGGKNPDPNQFDTSLVYSQARITIAPILIVGGLMVEIYAIFKKSKNKTV
jgi:hypothetical protein